MVDGSRAEMHRANAAQAPALAERDRVLADSILGGSLLADRVVEALGQGLSLKLPLSALQEISRTHSLDDTVEYFKGTTANVAEAAAHTARVAELHQSSGEESALWLEKHADEVEEPPIGPSKEQIMGQLRQLERATRFEQAADLTDTLASRLADYDSSIPFYELNNLLGLPPVEAGMRPDIEAIRQRLDEITETLRSTAQSTKVGLRHDLGALAATTQLSAPEPSS